MKKLFCIIVLFVLTISIIPVWAQLTPEQVTERPKWEEFLETAEVVSFEQPLDPRLAVTEPWKLTLEKDGVRMHAWWKNVEGRPKGFLDSWKWEIAAYRLDKLLELNMIPPFVMKRFRGDRGSCSLDYGNTITLRRKIEQDLNPSTNQERMNMNRAAYLQRAFDNLIANTDRNPGDVLYTPEWKMLLIDHSRAFYSTRKYTRKLLLDENSKPIPMPMVALPRVFVENLRALTFESIKEAVEEYLKDREIEAVLIRRDLIIEYLEKRIAKYGEAEVLY
jgi:hypothetical protein